MRLRLRQYTPPRTLRRFLTVPHCGPAVHRAIAGETTPSSATAGSVVARSREDGRVCAAARQLRNSGGRRPVPRKMSTAAGPGPSSASKPASGGAGAEGPAGGGGDAEGTGKAGGEPTRTTGQASSAQGNAGDFSATSTSPLNPTDANGSPASEARVEAKKSSPMQAVLCMGTPANGRQRGFGPTPYVHHFDSYSLVKQLQDENYTQKQAVTAMKAIRSLLAHYLDLAQGSVVSKSDVENETYLFRAACSELSAEVKNNRRVAEEHMRQQRTHLQHEVDILTQTLNQELLTLNDNVRGMFNDRRMTVREEQRATEGAIQQLTYKISIVLSSDAKSEIESLRWILIRRSVLGIVFMAVMTLGTLRYATYISNERQREADRRKKAKEEKRKHDGMEDGMAASDAAAVLTAS